MTLLSSAASVCMSKETVWFGWWFVTKESNQALDTDEWGSIKTESH
jgi:hypothetical protein